jgi:hypothetical protein
MQTRLPFQVAKVGVRATLAHFVPRSSDYVSQIHHREFLDYMGKNEDNSLTRFLARSKAPDF